MKSDVEALVAEVAGWPGVEAHPHRFGGTEFRLGTREIGHVHRDGTVDVPFPVAIREGLIAAGRAQHHHWLPESGWTTVHLKGGGREQAARVLRLNHLRYRLKAARAPGEAEALRGDVEALTRDLFTPVPPHPAQSSKDINP